MLALHMHFQIHQLLIAGSGQVFAYSNMQSVNMCTKTNL